MFYSHPYPDFTKSSDFLAGGSRKMTCNALSVYVGKVI